jgi:hypothetical protein
MWKITHLSNLQLSKPDSIFRQVLISVMKGAGELFTFWLVRRMVRHVWQLKIAKGRLSTKGRREISRTLDGRSTLQGLGVKWGQSTSHALSVCLNWGSTDGDEGSEDSEYDGELHCCVCGFWRSKKKARRCLECMGRLLENNNLNPFILCIIKISTALGPLSKDQVNKGNVSGGRCEYEIDRPWMRQ